MAIKSGFEPSISLYVCLYKKQFCGLVSRALNWELKPYLFLYLPLTLGIGTLNVLLWGKLSCELPLRHLLLGNGLQNKFLSYRKANSTL